MADEERLDLPDTATDDDTESPQRGGSWRTWVKWGAILVGVSIVIQGIVFGYSQIAAGSGDGDNGPEITLGAFHFEADPSEHGHIAAAEFNLHISLLQEANADARVLLDARQFRVQQDIEELLRQAHSGDFDDPKLGGLKRQLQEQINETLGMRAISDVIITDLELRPSDRQPLPIVEAADSVPWTEESAPAEQNGDS